MVKDNLTFPGTGTHHPRKLLVKLGRRQCWLSVTAGMGVWGTNALFDFLSQEFELTPWEAFLPCGKGTRCVFCPCPAVRQKLTFMSLLSSGERTSKTHFASLVPSGHKICSWPSAWGLLFPTSALAPVSQKPLVLHPELSPVQLWLEFLCLGDKAGTVQSLAGTTGIQLRFSFSFPKWINRLRRSSLTA